MSSSGERMSGGLRGSGGPGGYVGGWRVSLRLAARDLRAHKGRAVLVALLIGLPLLLVAGGGTLAYTKDVSPREGISRSMGSGQALLTVQGTDAIVQDWSGQITGSMDHAGRSKALHFQDNPKSPTAKDIESVTGGTAFPVGYTQPYVVLPDRSILARTLGIDGRQQVYDGMARLTSGRWPRTPDEVLVSRAGAAMGIPTHGTLTLHENAAGSQRTRTVQVVGEAYTPDAEALVTLPSGPIMSWVLQRRSPVQWSEVKQLNRYGVQVASRAVIDNPAQAKADPNERFLEDRTAQPVSLWVLLGTGLVVVIALLAGPAFAASGARHRRALGQLASNGASKSQLRRYVLAQALLLGALSALLAITLGGLLGGLAAKVYAQWSPTSIAPGPLDLRWGWGLILLIVAVFASLVAAFVPAVAASRVNLVAVLRGHVSVGKAHVGWPILGVLLVAGGGVVLFAALVRSESDDGGAADTSAPTVGGIILGAVALFAGALMTAPWLLARLGDLARFFPLPLRVAARDVGRQRGRAVATAGAILATVAVLTTAAITIASNTRAMEEAYEPGLPMGQALVTSNDLGALGPKAVSVVREQLPNASLTELRSLGSTLGVEPGALVHVTIGYQSKCTAAQTLAATDGTSCPSNFGDLMGNSLVTATPEQLARVFRLDTADVSALRAGRMLVPVHEADPTRPVTVVTGTGRQSDTGPLRDVRVTGQTSVPVSVSRQPYFGFVPPRQKSGGMTSSYGSSLTPTALMATDAVAKLPVRSFLAGILISNPGGVPSSAEQTIADRLNDPANGTFDHLYVERGYHNADGWIWAVIAAVFGLLVLVATLTSTALSNAESRADSATLASLGAPARLRRLIAGSNAAVIGLFGALLGLVVGGIAGYAASHPATQTALGSHATITVIPWGILLTVAIGVPLLAALLAALATRGRVPMTRRLT